MASLTTFVAGNVLTAAQLNDSYRAVQGLREVVPTSVTVTGVGSSGSVGTDGKVTFGTAASVSVNGCFTSSYDNYRIVFTLDSSANSAEFDFRLRAAGTDNSSSNYAWVRVLVNGNNGSVNGSSSTTSLTTLWRLVPVSGTYTSGATLDVLMPKNASYNTVVSGSGLYFDTLATNWSGGNNWGVTSVTTSYDGFTVFPSTGTVTGFVTVYGYAA